MRKFMLLLVGLAVSATALLGVARTAGADPSGPGGLPPGSPALTSCSTMSVGSSGECVRALQNAFLLLGVGLSVDGSFGPQTDAAVRAFQRSHGLADDGVAGPQTLGALAHALTQPRPPSTATGTVQGASPSGEVVEAGVYECGNTFGTCSFYFDRGTTHDIATWLEENERKGDAASTGVCLRIGLRNVLAGAGCEVFNLTMGGDFKQTAKAADAGHGCLRIRWTQDPMLPYGVYNDGGHNCIGSR